MSPALALQPLLARFLLVGEDDGWMQLLVLVLFAVVYGLGGILKARKRKLEPESDQETPPPARRRRPRPSGRAVGRPESAGPADVRRSVPPTSAGRQAPPAETRPARATSPVLQAIFQELGIEHVPEPAPPPPAPSPGKPRALRRRPPRPAVGAVEPARSITAEAARSVHAPIEPVLQGPTHPADGEQPARPTLPHLSRPDDLRSAILYLEILGKPVALRAPGEHLIGP